MKLLILFGAIAAGVAALLITSGPDPGHPAIVNRRPAAYPPRAVVELGVTAPERSAVAGAASEVQVESDVGKETPEPSGRVRWALASISSGERAALKRHQETARELLPYFTGEKSYEDPSRYGGAAWALAHVSIYSIFDAEGRTMTRSAYSALPREVFAEMTRDAEITSNDGRYYVLQRGEFPALDQTNDLLKEHNGNVPPDLLPFAELVELAELALSYQVK